MSILDTSCNILSLSNDGDDLSPNDLKFIENVANFGVNEEGEIYLYELETKLEKGIYKKACFYGVENLTQDHEGFVYYKDIHVEHYSYRDHEEGKKSAIILKSRCEVLEKNNIEISCHNAVWCWGKHDFQKVS